MNYYDYEDYKSEEEEIVDEAVEQIKNIIKERAKNELDAVQHQVEYYKEQTKLLEDSRNEAFKKRDAAQKELEDYKKQVDSANSVIKSLPFNIDDECWIVVPDGSDIERCPICGGNRSIDSYHPDYGTVKAECPYCGKFGGYDNQEFKIYKYRIKKCNISQVYVIITNKTDYRFSAKYDKYTEYSNITPYKTKEDAEIAMQKMLEEQDKKHEAWVKGAEACKIAERSKPREEV